MCGFAGFLTKGRPQEVACLEKMTTVLAHRGPDDQGFFGVRPDGETLNWKRVGDFTGALKLGLGFRRLSILDLSTQGSQPMVTSDQRFSMVFNGQVFNYLELKSNLQGVNYRSTTDTEVVLELLARKGVEGLSSFNGMFALALYDQSKRELLLARDPMGIKPLYYIDRPDGFYFASEIKGLFHIPEFCRSLNQSALTTYLLSHSVADPDTLFEGVKKLEPGHWMRLGENGVRESKSYWEFNSEPDRSVLLSEWTERLDQTLQGALNRQLRSDVPVGFFLSGGIDSSLLTVQASKIQQTRPTTFTIGFKWSQKASDNLDLLSSRLIRDRFDIQYHEMILQPSVVSLLRDVIETLEEPVADPAALCSHLICQVAHEHQFKVLISGQGGDELFGGYAVYPAGLLVNRVSQFPSSVVNGFRTVADCLPYSMEGRRVQSVHRMQKVLSSIQRPWPESFLWLRSPMRLEELRSLVNPDWLGDTNRPLWNSFKHADHSRNWDAMNQMMYLDMKTYLPNDNLTYSDKTSMRHSVELRVPLLDLEIARLMERVPAKYKATFRKSKILLKEVARKYLPNEIIHRRKAGFGIPLKEWFATDLMPMTREILSESNLNRHGMLNPVTVTKWMDEHQNLRADHSMKLYNLITLQMWIDRFHVR